MPGRGPERGLYLITPDERDVLLDVFRDAADFFFDHQTAFRVFYSVRGRI